MGSRDRGVRRDGHILCLAREKVSEKGPGVQDDFILYFFFLFVEKYLVMDSFRFY